MAKKAKPNEGSVSKELCTEFERRWDDLQSDLASLKGRYVSDCKEVRDDIKEMMQEAKERGIVLKPFKAHLKVRGLRNKIAEIRDELEPDDLSTFDYYDGDDAPAPAKVSKRRAAEQQADRDALENFEGESVQ